MYDYKALAMRMLEDPMFDQTPILVLVMELDPRTQTRQLIGVEFHTLDEYPSLIS